MSAHKASGPDGWTVSEFKALPGVFWEAAAVLLEQVENLGRWPAQLDHSLVALLPKPGARSPGDLRPISLLPVFYRIWSAARQEDLRAWAVGPGGGTFERFGRGALDAAWHLAADGQLEALEDSATAAVLADCSKAYDHVPLDALGVVALSRGFPERLLWPALAIYRATRWIRVEGAVAHVGRASCGVVAGCGMAVALLRAFLEPLLERALASIPAPVRCRRYVDDVVLVMRGAPADAARGVLRA